jgi:hypothetical protein
MSNSDVNELHEKISGLERRKAALRKQLDEERPQIEQLREKLRLLEEGFFGKGGRRWFLVLVLLLCSSSVGACVYFMVFKEDAPPEIRALVYEAQTPRLLVTSVPEVALVLVDGKQEGKTPLLWRAPGGQKVTVKVQAAGYKPATRVIQIPERRGTHWHAVLTGGEPGNKGGAGGDGARADGEVEGKQRASTPK